MCTIYFSGYLLDVDMCIFSLFRRPEKKFENSSKAAVKSDIDVFGLKWIYLILSITYFVPEMFITPKILIFYLKSSKSKIVEKHRL